MLCLPSTHCQATSGLDTSLAAVSKPPQFAIRTSNLHTSSIPVPHGSAGLALDSRAIGPTPPKALTMPTPLTTQRFIRHPSRLLWLTPRLHPPQLSTLSFLPQRHVQHVSCLALLHVNVVHHRNSCVLFCARSCGNCPLAVRGRRRGPLGGNVGQSSQRRRVQWVHLGASGGPHQPERATQPKRPGRPLAINPTGGGAARWSRATTSRCSGRRARGRSTQLRERGGGRRGGISIRCHPCHPCR